MNKFVICQISYEEYVDYDYYTVEYSSKEKLIKDFTAAQNTNPYDPLDSTNYHEATILFEFGNRIFNKKYQYKIYNLEEWFNNHLLKIYK